MKKMALGKHCKEVRDDDDDPPNVENIPDMTADQTKIDFSIYETEQLRQLLRKRLDESGWRRRLRDRVQTLVYNMPFKKLSVEDVVQELAPKASSTISDEIKHELLLVAMKSLNNSMPIDRNI